MTKKQQAQTILGNRATWELKQMRKALMSLGGFFNSDEDDDKLEAINILLNKQN